MTPRYRLSGGNGLTLPSPLASSSRPESASRNGLSLPRNDCPAPDHHSELNVPGLLLRIPAEPPSGPSGLLLHHPPRFRSRSGQFHRSDPLPERLPSTPGVSSDLHSPSGFSSPMDRSVQSDLVPGKLAFRLRPISLRSPQPNLLKVSATDQRSRSATLP